MVMADVFALQDYMLNAPGKEMDLLRVTVKVPGKRPPRAVPACGVPVGLNGRVKDVPGPEGVSPGQSRPFFFSFLGASKKVYKVTPNPLQKYVHKHKAYYFLTIRGINFSHTNGNALAGIENMP